MGRDRIDKVQKVRVVAMWDSGQFTKKDIVGSIGLDNRTVYKIIDQADVIRTAYKDIMPSKNDIIEWVNRGIKRGTKEVVEQYVYEEVKSCNDYREKILAIGEKKLWDSVEKMKVKTPSEARTLSTILNDVQKRYKIDLGVNPDNLQSLSDEIINKQIRDQFRRIFFVPEKGDTEIIEGAGKKAEGGENKDMDSNGRSRGIHNVAPQD